MRIDSAAYSPTTVAVYRRRVAAWHDRFESAGAAAFIRASEYSSGPAAAHRAQT